MAWPSTSTRTSSCTTSSTPAGAIPALNSVRIITTLAPNSEAIFDARRAQGGPRAARGMALHVHGDRVHGDVRGGGLDVHGKGGRVAAEALRADAEHVDRLAELGFELRAFGIGAARAEGTRRGKLGEMRARIGGAAHADAEDGRRAGLAAGIEHAIDDEGLDGVDALGRHRHAQPRIVLRSRALRDHLDGERLVVGEVDVDDRHAAAAVVALVDARERMDHRRAQRMLVRRALAAAADRFLERHAVDFDAAADPDVVDRDAGVLAEKIVGVLGDRDVADHGAEHALRAGVALLLREALEALLDVRRQLLQRPDVELLRRLLDLSQLDFHLTSILRSLTTLAQSCLSAFIAAANCAGELPTGASPCA